MSFLSDYDALASKLSLTNVTRFDCYYDVYGLSLNTQSDEQQKTISLIAKSPASAPAQALAINLQRFEPNSLNVILVFAQLEPIESLAFVMQSLRKVSSTEPALSIRWAKNRALLDAHERLTLGRTLCWTGDSMRRSDDSRSAIDRVDEENPLMLAEATASFEAIWRAAKPLPKVLLATSLNFPAQSPAHDPYQPELTPDFYATQLEDYLRSRRH
jgi:hypothetical protein